MCACESAYAWACAVVCAWGCVCVFVCACAFMSVRACSFVCAHVVISLKQIGDAAAILFLCLPSLLLLSDGLF